MAKPTADSESKGSRPRRQLVEDDADRVEIAAVIELGAAGLLGRHVLGRAADEAGAGERGALVVGAVDDLGDAEVEHLDEVGLVAPLLHHDVLGLEIAVDDAGAVRVGERREHLGDDAHHAGLGQRPLAGEHGVQVLALHVLHGDVHGAVFGLAEVEHADGVGVVQAAGGLGLALEAGDGALVAEEGLAQHLEHDRLVEVDLDGLVDLAHAALAEHLLDAVLVGDGLADVVVTGAHGPGDFSMPVRRSATALARRRQERAANPC